MSQKRGPIGHAVQGCGAGKIDVTGQRRWDATGENRGRCRAVSAAYQGNGIVQGVNVQDVDTLAIRGSRALKTNASGGIEHVPEEDFEAAIMALVDVAGFAAIHLEEMGVAQIVSGNAESHAIGRLGNIRGLVDAVKAAQKGQSGFV